MNTNCSICIKPVQDSTNIIVAECGHIFHCLCLMTNVAYNGIGCPHCRTKMAKQDADDEDELEDITFRFRRFLDADANADDDDDDDDLDDTNTLLLDDMLRGFRVFNNLLDGVDHDDADDVAEEYYNIRCDPDESADYNLRTGHHYNENGDDDG